MKFPAQPSPDEFCAALRAAGREADLGDYCHADGFLPDGRWRDLGNPDDRYEASDVPLPQTLLMAVNESEADEAVVCHATILRPASHWACCRLTRSAPM
jgi:hypothetical protein